MNLAAGARAILRPVPGGWGRRACAMGLLAGAAVAFGQTAATNPPAKSPQGLTYIHDDVRDGPRSVHIFKVARSRPDWDLVTTLGRGTSFGMAVVSDQVQTVPPEAGRPVAAINGDFYARTQNYLGDPDGLQITRGELMSGPFSTRTCFWMDAQRNFHRTNVLSRFEVRWPDGTKTPFGLNEDRGYDGAVLFTSVIGSSTQTGGGRELVLQRHGTNSWLPLQVGKTYSAQVREVRERGDTALGRDIMILSLGSGLAARAPKVAAGAVLQISTATVPDLAGATVAIGGGPTLVKGGKPGHWGYFQIRHPRAAIGWNKDFFFLVEVDGRQSISIGMTYSELAEYMAKKLGCEEALNLDGGGSATLWAYGTVMNSPSPGYERPSANALVVVVKNAPEKK